MTANRIDVHQHVISPVWLDGLRRRNSFHRPPAWSPEAAIAFMDSQQIATGILSLTAPGIVDWDDIERRNAAREVNESTATLVAKCPGRFGNFATLPLPDMDSSLLELAYAFDALEADGVILFSNYANRYLGDAFFEPLWVELDRREAIVFIHPTRLSEPEIKGLPGPIIDFPFGTTRTAVDMVLKGVLDRHRKLKIILSHGGGFLPYAAYRFAGLAAAVAPGASDAGSILEKFRRFYFDTALVHCDFALASLKALADPARILFGSDFPYAPDIMAKEVTSQFDASTLLTAGERAAINHDNARALFRGKYS